MQICHPPRNTESTVVRRRGGEIDRAVLSAGSDGAGIRSLNDRKVRIHGVQRDRAIATIGSTCDDGVTKIVVARLADEDRRVGGGVSRSWRHGRAGRFVE